MTAVEFMTLFEHQYVSDTTRKKMRDMFRKMRQGSMSVNAYARRFIELSLFAPEVVATDALRVGRFRKYLRDDIGQLCRSPRPLIYFELLNMVLELQMIMLPSVSHLRAEEDLSAGKTLT